MPRVKFSLSEVLPGAGAGPSVSIRAGICPELARVPYLRELFKLKLRSLVHRRSTRHWLELLNSHPAFSDYVRQCPRILYKIYRPYMTLSLPIEARLAALAAHYRVVFERGLSGLVMQAVREPVPLARFEGRDGTSYEIVLRAIALLEREGELVLQLRADGMPLFSAAFTIAPREGCLAVNIGCIQGTAGEGTREAIRSATRQLHGTRPKQLLVSLVRHIGHLLGCSELRLVSNANRVVRSAIRNGSVLADYDQLWEEMGARRLPDGDYCLPCGAPEAPDFEAVPSKKRAEARRRHALLDEVCMALGTRLRAG
jgi:uncharacterized protein VirK/YbjX